MKTKAHHTSFPVADLEKSRSFYSRILGLVEIERPDIFEIPGAWFNAGPCEVHLIEVGPDADVGETSKTVNPAARHAAFEIDDYVEALEYLRAHDISVVETSPEFGQMWIADPDGHVLELIKPRT